MRYTVRDSKGHSLVATVLGRRGGRVSVEVGGRRTELVVLSRSKSSFLVCDGMSRTHKVYLAWRQGEFLGRVDGRIGIVRPGTGTARARGGRVGEKQVTVQMPGRVVKVLVEEGQSVSAGQGLVILEAMKMENELKAPTDGKVRRVNCNEGQTVESGAVVVELE